MGQADAAIAFARAQIGKPYEFGEEGPNGFDCSGLVYAAYNSAGVHLGRTTVQQIFDGSEVSRSELAPGDLLFPDPGHVQLYVGNNEVIEAPHSGAFVRETAVWGFWRARRVADPGSDTSTESPTITTVGDPLSGVVKDAINEVLSNLPLVKNAEGISNNLLSATFLKRIGVGILAALVIIISIILINRRSAGK